MAQDIVETFPVVKVDFRGGLGFSLSRNGNGVITGIKPGSNAE